MRAAFAVISLLVASPVFSQQVYHLDVEANDLVSIGTALNELPKRVADPLITKLQMQVNAQNEAAKKAQESKPEAKPEDAKP